MTGRQRRDAVVVGSGPNGLAAAVTLAAAGLDVEVVEAATTAGGGSRTRELTLPGHLHDVCSAVHPMAVASPFFTAFDLRARGVELLEPEVQFAHPLDDGPAGLVLRDLDATAEGLGADGGRYARLMRPLVEHADALLPLLLAPVRRPPTDPRALRAATEFGARAGLTLPVLARLLREPRAAALLAGVAAHTLGRQTGIPNAAAGLMLTTLAHSHGWLVPRGGSQALTDALLADLRRRGATVTTGRRVRSLAELPPARAVLLDVSPAEVLRIAGDRLPARYAAALRRYRYGPGAFKVDYVLSGPVPWRDPGARRAGTLHLGGTWQEIAAAEAEVAAGRHAERPYVLLAQPSALDPSRAPDGHHVLWAYCHVPNGSTLDRSEQVDAQIERFAPGFRDLVVARHVQTAAGLERENPADVGGDFAQGATTLRQVLARPVPRWDVHAAPLPGLYLCSSSTAPGPGVHGMCGWWAARSALRRTFGITALPALAPA
ncbi:phytoene dehydrogenase-like protein [Kineococcus xinjiangensis]|uniref:Phytoene dehydrogenase-like protein n=1 Tax=Kineococcus xinjiangensis TaxID=512762 RepID=A0A2S6ISJ8_9ACTN|nr:NAD(P)/FAD-dependent oxidoreductase [Kineococcus xinjiangensis]PPK97227.1 phytoene dehydrogenase-like protein [Kineococcus xinjiangensis]